MKTIAGMENQATVIVEVAEVGQYLSLRATNSNMSLREFSRELGFSVQYISEVILGKRPMSDKLATAIGLVPFYRVDPKVKLPWKPSKDAPESKLAARLRAASLIGPTAHDKPPKPKRKKD